MIQILPQVTGEGKNGPWKKQEFIIETGDTYPKKVCLAIWGDKIDISKVAPGTTVTLQFDAESREYNGRWYTDLRVYGLKAGAEKPRPAESQVNEEETDDLPF